MTDMSNSPIGKSIVRKEDYRFLTGVGQYTDDVVMQRQTHAYFLRSPHAHARIRSIDTSAAASAPGVVAIFTGADLQESKVGGLPCGWLIHSKDGTPMKEPAHPVLAYDKVRHVGDQLAVVVAETYLQARDAAELIDVEYETLPAVADTASAAGHAVTVHDDVPGNVCYDWGHGDAARSTPLSRRPPDHAARVHQQQADPERHGAARRPTRSTAVTMTATRSMSPTRTRMSSGC
jgi:carbon-monoxide dehydrogenase large subunit